MAETDHYQRGHMLYGLGRYKEACAEFVQCLKDNPRDASALAMLSLSQCARGDFDQATSSAAQAVGADPNRAFAHYAMAFVAFRKADYKKAGKAIADALRISPENADYLDLSARILFSQGKFKEAEAEAEVGLKADPHHVDCLNIRAMSMIRLGKGQEALSTVDTALGQDPNCANSHANKGWILLEQNRAKEAMPHFRESLRIEPNSEWTRKGLVETLRHRHPFYGVIAALSLVVSSVGRNRALYFILWVIPAFRGAMLLMMLVTWWGTQFFNLLLCLDPLTREVLSADEVKKSLAFGAVSTAGILILLLGLCTNFFSPSGFPLALLINVLVAIPVCRTFDCKGRFRTFMLGYSGIVVAAGTYAIFTLRNAIGDQWSEPGSAMFTLVFFMAICSFFIPKGKSK